MDLITLAEYKNYKSLSNPENDSVLQTIISSVSNLIKTYCGRTFIDFYSNTKTEYVTVKPGVSAILLQEVPIREIINVVSDGLSIVDDVTIDKSTGIIYSPRAPFTPGASILSISYTGGFVDTPADVKLACLELVDYYYKEEHRAKRSFGGTTVEYEQTKNSWPFHIQSILNNYRDL